ncbi:MAG: GAF domain-containing protein [Anaerolineaceae bacterium]|nr:GAF domain-containing protein [Anaerolineaceae bacterium]
MDSVDVLVAVRREQASRFYKNLTAQKNFRVNIVSDTGDALRVLDDRDQHVDVLVLDNGLSHIFEFVADLRHSYPRLLIVLVDEDADFGLPGQADEISTEPFENNDLVRRITRLMSDRQLETLRADSLPAVRQFAKELRKASGELGKQEAAVAACKDLGYDYVAFYRRDDNDADQLLLKAQDGSNPIKSVAPRTTAPDDLMSWVHKNRQSRISNPPDSPNHPLVAKGRLGCAACVPVIFGGNHYGVLLACREQPDSINQENVLMLELVAAQLSAAISKEIIG